MGAETSVLAERLRWTAWELGAAVLGGAPGRNQAASPAGLLVALAMLRAGAGSGTAAELDAVLGVPDGHRNEAVGALLASWAQFDGDPASVSAARPPRRPVLHLATGLFADRGMPLGPAFRQSLAACFGCDVQQVDFGTPAAAAALDGWVREHTGGRIAGSPLGHDDGTTLSLLSVLTFAAAWADPFAPAEGAEPFTLASGARVKVPMMFKLLAAGYAAGPGWQAVDLPYAGGFLMRLVLPEHGSPVPDAALLAAVAQGLAAGPPALVALGLPKWGHRCTVDLKPVLAGLGLAGTVGRTPDFEAIHKDAVIASAAQAVSITVAEEGTVAAAVTEVEMVCGSLPEEPEVRLVFDRPFLYQIIHEGTGMPLFLGTVMDPRG